MAPSVVCTSKAALSVTPSAVSSPHRGRFSALASLVEIWQMKASISAEVSKASLSLRRVMYESSEENSVLYGLSMRVVPLTASLTQMQPVVACKKSATACSSLAMPSVTDEPSQ